jgi:hypothetical protein
MPTPESAAFLAKKPTVPPTFDGVDYDDYRALQAARDAIVREQWVKVMMLRLVGQELDRCYRREGVNHFEKCTKFRGGFARRIAVNWTLTRTRAVHGPAEGREGQGLSVRAGELHITGNARRQLGSKIMTGGITMKCF